MIKSNLPQKVYCAWAKDDATRNAGSSGGIFGVLAKRFINMGGCVVGAAYDEQFTVKHILVDQLQRLPLLYKSKYVQSSMKDVWGEMEKVLAKGKKVLFSGTPCQVDAVKRRFAEYEEQLYTIDLICHGTPDPKVWKLYINSLKRKWHFPILSVDFRKKDEYAWQQRKIQITFQNEVYISSKGEDPFCQLFLDDVILQEGCYSCQYATTERVADITLGDFWGLKGDHSIAENHKGLSMVLLNSEKGMYLFSTIGEQISYIEKSIAEAVKDTVPLQRPPRRHPYREVFYQDLAEWSLDWTIRKYLDAKSDKAQRMYNFTTFHNLTRLKVEDKNIEAYMKSLGFKEVYLYGYGEVGRCFIHEITDKSMIKGIIDVKFDEKVQMVEGWKAYSPCAIPDDDLPIVISTAYQYQAISLGLIKNGIDRFRLISYAELVRWCLEGRKLINKRFLITGAQFSNKGAQAMLYVTIDEIRKRFCNAEIYFLPCVREKYDFMDMKRHKINFLSYAAINGNNMLFEQITGFTAIVDVSGYALSSHWDDERYLQVLRIARNYRIPIFLMPQSFGPFDFEAERKKEVIELLRYATVIYAREKGTAEYMEEELGLSNVQLSDDLVLQNKGIEEQNIFNEVVHTEYETLPTDAVAVVPNVRSLEFGNNETVYALYNGAIKILQKYNKQVYLIPHSHADVPFCEQLLQMNQDVRMPWVRLECYEYERIISQFEFALVSRYHGLVHAYKQKVPCIVLGWAEKYIELARSMGQSKYVFDVKKPPSEQEWSSAILNMMACLEDNRKLISTGLERIQKNNCFDCLNVLKEERNDCGSQIYS